MKYKVIAGLVMLCMACSVQGTIIAGWDVDGVVVAEGQGIDEAEKPYTFRAGTVAENIVEAKMTLGSGLEPSTATSQYGFKITEPQDSLSNAIEADHYLQVEVTVADGYVLNLESLEMKGRSTGTGCDNVAWLFCRKGFEEGKEVVALDGRRAAGGGGLDTAAPGFGGPVDLGAEEFQGLTGTIVFRLYGWNSGGRTGVTNIRNLSGDDLVLRGSVNEAP